MFQKHVILDISIGVAPGWKVTTSHVDTTHIIVKALGIIICPKRRIFVIIRLGFKTCFFVEIITIIDQIVLH